MFIIREVIYQVLTGVVYLGKCMLFLLEVGTHSGNYEIERKQRGLVYRGKE